MTDETQKNQPVEGDEREKYLPEAQVQAPGADTPEPGERPAEPPKPPKGPRDDRSESKPKPKPRPS